jgi:sugar lactone lactonase YvrE
MAALEPLVGAAAIPCTTEQAILGEGARWDARREELLRVDILAGRVFRDQIDVDGGLVPVRAYTVPGAIAAITPIDGDDGWLLAAGRGFVHLRPDGTWYALAEVAPTGTRMNDAACDPQGRLWAGTLTDDHRPGGGALFRLDRAGGIERVLDGLTISNGLGWSPDGGTMYLADSGPRVIHAFAFDAARGRISDGRVLLTIPEAVGAPDGLTVDAGGDLWVAVYGGGCVRRYGPDGVLHQVLDVPTEQSTSCAFGGAGMARLYVTTATEGWSDERRRAEPGAGLVYRLDTDASGLAACPFRPDPDWWMSVTSDAASSMTNRDEAATWFG